MFGGRTTSELSKIANEVRLVGVAAGAGGFDSARRTVAALDEVDRIGVATPRARRRQSGRPVRAGYTREARCTLWSESHAENGAVSNRLQRQWPIELTGEDRQRLRVHRAFVDAREGVAQMEHELRAPVGKNRLRRASRSRACPSSVQTQATVRARRAGGQYSQYRIVESYSARSAVVGSTRVARHAGM